MSNKNFQVKNGLTVGTTSVDAATGNTIVGGDLQVNGNDIKSATGATAITLNDNTTILAGDLQVDGTIVGLAQDTTIAYDENNDRTNRPTVQSISGNSSGLRVRPPVATTSALAVLSVGNTNDQDNTTFISLQASGSTTEPMRIASGKYTAGVFGPSGKSISVRDGTTTYATLNPAGPTNSSDLTTKSYVDGLIPTVPSYDTNVVSVAGGAELDLREIIGAGINIVGSTKFIGGTNITVSETASNEITINGTDLNTTYDFNATSTTGGVNLNLVGSDATTDTVKITSGTGVTASYVSGTEVSVAIGQAVGTSDDVQFGSVRTPTINANGGVSFVNTSVGGSTYATVNQFGPFNSTDLTTVDWVNSQISSTSPVLSVNTQTGAVVLDTDDISEGATNKYFSDTLARQSISATGNISYNSTTGVISTSLTQYTDADARNALSGGTGVSYNSGTGVIAIGQPVGTTDDVSFNTVNANITDGNYVLGQLIATRNTSYVPPTSPLTNLAGTNGIVVSSSSGGAGYNAGIAMRYHVGDTSAGAFSSAAITQSVAGGTNMAPSGISTNAILGTTNYDGYTAGTSNNYTTQIASANQGGGVNAITALQAQAYARQAFTNSTTLTTAVTGASGTGSVATLTFTTQNTAPYAVGQTVTVAGMTPSGYNGTVVITAATTSSISYANTTTGFTSGGTIAAANTVTAAGAGFRIRGFANSTPMTTGNRFNFMDLTASAATFKADAYTFANSVITGSTLTATNYMTLGATTGSINQDTFTLKNTAGTTTYATLNSTSATLNGDTINLRNTAGTTTYGNFTATGANITAAGLSTVTRTTVGTPGVAENRPSMNIQLIRSDQAAPNDNDGTSFRTRVGGSNGTFYTIADINATYRTGGDIQYNINLANGDQTGSTFSSLPVYTGSITKTTIRAGTASGTPGASSVSTVATFEPTKITAAVPIAFPVYTAAQANALTGAVGWQICISDSAGGSNPNGMMAFWDTTNARWSYIHDNSAV
jgi:hypothetical protein